MLLQEVPADTFNYMLFGFIVILGTIGLYLASLVMRVRNRAEDMEVLQEIEQEGE